ncbi:isoleucine--tRNA ligase [Candidatus Saccharibacteria bacterium]|nr:isoleucine--tRNA ligase [Candidatus Saccharibacteria bacterium]
MSTGISEKSAAALAEEAMLKLWDKEKTFQASQKLRQNAPYYSFYDGPPFASGEPHYGHLEQTTVKDAVARYKTMRGFMVPRRTGWDTHGLPIEYNIEKELGLNSKKDILDYGIDKFNDACRAIVFRHKDEFDQMYRRMGRWSDPNDNYATLNTDYIESVWWALAEINKKGLLYRGFKSMPYCPRCETPLSNFELNEGYKDNVSDPSVFVLFPLTEKSLEKIGANKAPGAGEQAKTGQVYLLAWTTTPWTLPANAALGVDPKADYAFVQLKSDGSTLILAKKRLAVLDLNNSHYSLLKTVKGQDLVGLRYQPLYGVDEAKISKKQVNNAWQILAEDSVDLADGTGILHSAPRYGEADLSMGLAHDLPLIESVDSSGHLIWGPKAAIGKFFKSADEHIIADLTKKGRIFAAESGFKHTYPFCWRCETPLMYFATTTWFVAVSQIRDQLLKNAAGIKWVPAHIKVNRFGKWLEGARDWAISRNRYWGAPLPIWVNEADDSDYLVVGSLAELEKLNGGLPGEDLHRPFIDKIVIKKNGQTYRRVEEVLDCWFESGSMPYGQDHYPFENKAVFEQKFPADFIVEGMDQVRLWFYTLHVLATVLFDQPAYKNVVADGLILAADGKKLSKRLRNYPPIEQLLDKYGADVIRLFVLSSPLMAAEDTRMSDETFRDLQRNVFMTLQNSFSFFKTYADVDKWQAPAKLTQPETVNLMDLWLLARLNQTIAAVSVGAEAYQLQKATRPLIEFVNDLSNWYIRRSRRRFWKSQNDQDKSQAYATLHYVLARLCQLLAPWAPFISDQLWRELLPGGASVHLSDWPAAEELNRELVDEMAKIRKLISIGHAQRAEEGIKVRQPLSKAYIALKSAKKDDYAEILRDELNVKEIVWTTGQPNVRVATLITPELRLEGFIRELVRETQQLRKHSKFNVDDKIKVRLLHSDDFVERALRRHGEYYYAEVLGSGAEDRPGQWSSKQVIIDGHKLDIEIWKA